MNQYELHHSWSTHRLLLGPSGDVWKPRLRQTNSFSCVYSSLLCRRLCYTAGFPRLVQVSWIHLRAVNLSVHWSEEGRKATQHRSALLRTAAADNMQAFRTCWISRLAVTAVDILGLMSDLSVAQLWILWGKDLKMGKMQQNEKLATRWNQQENKRQKAWEGERSGETERETDIQRFPFTLCLSWVMPHPLENGALCLAVGELTFTACLLLLWLFSPPGVIASLQSLRNNAASELRGLGMRGRIRSGQTFYWNNIIGWFVLLNWR